MSDFANAQPSGGKLASVPPIKAGSNTSFPSLEQVDAGLHANSAESFNDRVRRTIAGVFHHISPEHADLYFNEVGFRWSLVPIARRPRELRTIAIEPTSPVAARTAEPVRTP